MEIFLSMPRIRMWRYPWEEVEKQMKLLRGEPRREVPQDGQGEAFNAVSESQKKWTKILTYAVRNSECYSVITYENLFIPDRGQVWRLWHMQPPIERLMKFYAQTIPIPMKIELNMLAGERARTVAQLEVHTRKAAHRIWKIVTMLAKSDAEAQERWIKAEAVKRMKEEEEFMLVLKEINPALELLLQTVQKHLLKKRIEQEEYRAVLASAVALLSLVYQYLTSYVDRGGTKTYSPGSLEFGSTYISIVLFQGAYVWLKCRDVASSNRGGYRRPITDKLSGTIKRSEKIEARYKPPRESGNQCHIYLGVCATDEEAGIKKKIAEFCYGRNTGRLEFDDGQYFLIPLMPTEQQEGLSVTEKRTWVKKKVKEVYNDIKAYRAIHSSALHLDEQIINAPHLSSLIPTEEFRAVSEGPNYVAFDPVFRVEENLQPLSEGIDEDFCTFLEGILADPSEVTSESSSDAEPQQHLQDKHVQDKVIAMPALDNHCDGPLDVTELPQVTLSAWGSESVNLDVVQASAGVAATSNEVHLCGLTEEGAPNNSQAVSEFPFISHIPSLENGSDAMAILGPDVVTPSVMNLCSTNSTSDLLVFTVISLFQQQLQEKDRKIEERDRRIFELERENERLRGTSQDL